MNRDLAQDGERWLLPEGIDELLPGDAWPLEMLRRRLLDHYRSRGYDLVLPPFVEYLESLLTGVGEDLGEQTFKLVDPLTGRLMGVRADITPQAARIDAHRLAREEPVRLCYIGTVLRTHADELGGSRAPLQVGAELYGHTGIESDLEIIGLMLETLALTGVGGVHLDLGHVGVFRSLFRELGLAAEAEARLFEILQRKARTELAGFLDGLGLGPEQRRMLACLVDLNGGAEALSEARERLAGAGSSVHRALAELEDCARRLRERHPELILHFDLAELRGYRYQTGLVYAAFVPGVGQEVARGGRYDEIGRVFGRARPATGFSADLKALVAIAGVREDSGDDVILAPAEADAGLERLVEELRRRGERVARALPGAREGRHRRRIERRDGRWQVVESGG